MRGEFIRMKYAEHLATMYQYISGHFFVWIDCTVLKLVVLGMTVYASIQKTATTFCAVIFCLAFVRLTLYVDKTVEQKMRTMCIDIWLASLFWCASDG